MSPKPKQFRPSLKANIASLVIVIMLVLQADQAFAANPLAVPAYRAVYSCWAGSGAAISAFFKSVTSTSTIKGYEKKIYEKKYGPGASPGMGGYVDDVVAGVKLITGKNGSYQGNSLSYNAVKWQTNHGGPISAVLANYQSNGSVHFITIRGYNDQGGQYVEYVDPKYGTYNTKTHSYLVNTWRWANSAFWK